MLSNIYFVKKYQTKYSQSR